MSRGSADNLYLIYNYLKTVYVLKHETTYYIFFNSPLGGEFLWYNASCQDGAKLESIALFILFCRLLLRSVKTICKQRKNGSNKFKKSKQRNSRGVQNRSFHRLPIEGTGSWTLTVNMKFVKTPIFQVSIFQKKFPTKK